jgi:hypothetical protein
MHCDHGIKRIASSLPPCSCANMQSADRVAQVQADLGMHAGEIQAPNAASAKAPRDSELRRRRGAHTACAAQVMEQCVQHVSGDLIRA